MRGCAASRGGGGFDLASRDANGSFTFRGSWQGGFWADLRGPWNHETGERADYMFGVLGFDMISSARLLVGFLWRFAFCPGVASPLIRVILDLLFTV